MPGESYLSCWTTGFCCSIWLWLFILYCVLCSYLLWGQHRCNCMSFRWKGICSLWPGQSWHAALLYTMFCFQINILHISCQSKYSKGNFQSSFHLANIYGIANACRYCYQIFREKYQCVIALRIVSIELNLEDFWFRNNQKKKANLLLWMHVYKFYHLLSLLLPGLLKVCKC